MAGSDATTLLDGLLGAERPVLVLSPHMDDAMLSASAVVLSRSCEVWTVFAGKPSPPQRTTWDTSCGFADSDETIETRRGEDRAAFAGTPAKAKLLDCWEGAYTDPDRRRADLADAGRQISTWMTAHPSGTIVLPAGAGVHVAPAPWAPLLTQLRRLPRSPGATPNDAAQRQVASSGRGSTSHEVKRVLRLPRAALQQALHADYLRRRRAAQRRGLAANPDHLTLRDLTLDLAQDHPALRLVLYEDLPYLWHQPGDDEVGRVVRRRRGDALRTELPVDVDRKLERLQHYDSQLDVIDDRGRLRSRDGLPGIEVYWVLEPDCPRGLAVTT